jgi:hypothetical protein
MKFQGPIVVSTAIFPDEIEAPARMTLSGLTALVKLQADGYQRVY